MSPGRTPPPLPTCLPTLCGAARPSVLTPRGPALLLASCIPACTPASRSLLTLTSCLPNLLWWVPVSVMGLWEGWELPQLGQPQGLGELETHPAEPWMGLGGLG